MKPSYRRTCLLLLLTATFACPTLAAAQQPEASESIFKRGVAAMETGDYANGCKDIAEAQRIDPRPGTLFTLATCQDRWGHVATAMALYGEYLTLYEGLPEDRKAKQGDRPKVAKAQREKLGLDVPDLTLVLPPNAPPGTVVTRGGQIMAAAALGVGLAVDPGEQLVTTQAPGGPVVEQRIAIGKGEKKKVTLEVKPAPAAEAPPPPKVEVQPPKPAAPPVTAPPVVPRPATTGMSARRKAAYATGGVGLAGLALGGVMGALTLGKKGVISAHCGAAIKREPSACDQTGLDAVNSASTLGLVSTLGVVTGLAGLGTGLVLLLTDRPAKSPKTSARGWWVAAELLPAGSAGAIVGLRGAW